MSLFLTIALLAGQAAAPAPAPAATTATAAKLDASSPIADIVASPQGKAVLEKELPALLSHPMFDSFKSMNLRELQSYSNGQLTDEKIAAVDTALKAIK